MGFNNATERKKFEQRWASLRKKYRKAGMPKEKIDEMYEFDWSTFLSERRYREHTQPLPTESINEDEDGMSGLFKKFDSLKVTFSEDDFSGRYSWVETIEDPDLHAKVASLSLEDLELITLVAIEDYNQSDLERIGYQRQYTTSRRLAKIKKFFET